MRGWHDKQGSTFDTGFPQLSENLGGIGAPDAQLETPKPELHRIPHRCAPDKCNRGAEEQAHFAQTHRQLLVPRQAGDDGTLAWFERGERDQSGKVTGMLRC